MTPDPKVQPPPPGSAPVSAQNANAPHLRRVLGMGDLVFYGIVLIQPVGAIGIFGLANKMSLGHVTLTIFIALAAMMLTAWSYGRMAGLYPAAGSAYTYVGRGLHPYCGFVAGWAMFLDYLVIPIVSVVYCAISMQKGIETLFPGQTHAIASFFRITNEQDATTFFWAVVFVALTTWLNIRGIKWTARANQILTAAMFLVIGLFVIQAIRYLWSTQGWAGLFSTEPFYNAGTFRIKAVGEATSLAAITYIGFDGITTLAEDAKEPKRTVPFAVVSVCLLIGLCAGVEIYLAQRVWPDYNTFKVLDTAFFDVCELIGGRFLLNSMVLIMVIACLGSTLTGQVGAARILFGMGRDNALPKMFARLDKRNNPVLNIVLIGILVLVGAKFLKYADAATLINFGAFLAFMGVNLAVIREFFFRPPMEHRPGLLNKVVMDLAAPAIAFIFCLWIWLLLPKPAKIVGGIWCAVGIVYMAIKTKGFRKEPIMVDLNV